MYDLSIVEEQTLLAVLDTGSFSAAGEQLGISQSSVSRRIAALELRLGGKRLLSRTTRRVEATEHGAAYAARVREALSLLHDAAEHALGEDDRPAGLLRLSVPPGLGRAALLPALARLALRFPGLDYDILLASSYLDLYEGKLDMAIRLTPFQRTDTRLEHLGRVRWVFTAAPEYLQIHDGQRPDGHRFVALNMRTGGPVNPDTAQLFRKLKRHNLRVGANDTPTLHQFVLAGLGVGLLPWPLIQDDVIGGRLELVNPGLPNTESAVFGIYRRCLHGMPKIHAVLEAFADALDSYEETFQAHVEPLGAAPRVRGLMR